MSPRVKKFFGVALRTYTLGRQQMCLPVPSAKNCRLRKCWCRLRFLITVRRSCLGFLPSRRGSGFGLTLLDEEGKERLRLVEKRVRSGPARNQFRLVGRHYPIWLFAMRVVDGTDARTRSALRTPRFNRRVGGQNVPLLGPVRDRAGRCPRGERAAIP